MMNQTRHTKPALLSKIRTGVALAALVFSMTLIAAPQAALADCTTPDSPAGGLNYVDGTTGFQWCDGTDWQDFGADNTIIFEVTGGAGTELVRQIAANAPLATSDFLFGSTQLADTGNVDHDARMFFDKSKAAFRAGKTDSSQWNDANVGIRSVAFGNDTRASGTDSAAFGDGTIASGSSSFAAGFGTLASADYGATAFGWATQATGSSSFAAGLGTKAAGGEAFAIGYNTTASASRSLALGDRVRATAVRTFAIGLSAQTDVDANRPQVSGAGSIGIFMDQADNYNLAATDQLAIIGGELMIDTDAVGTDKGCIRYNDTDDELEFSNDCTTYATISDIAASSSGLWSNDGAEGPAEIYYNGGNVGIGTNNPSSKLHIASAAPSLELSTSTANVGSTSLLFTHDINRKKVAIYSDPNGSWGRGDIKFAINTLNDNTPVSAANTRLTITSEGLVGTAGNFGAGTTSPGDRIEAYKAGDAIVRISSGNNAGNSILRFSHSNAGSTTMQKAAIIAPATGTWGRSTGLFFAINDLSDITNVGLADSKLAILANGNVGIGTNDPTTKLEVIGTGRYSGELTLDGGLHLIPAADASSIKFGNQGSGYGAYFHKNLLDFNFFFGRHAHQTGARLRFFSNQTLEVMTLLGTGNVGIGTNTPSTLFHVAKSDAANPVTAKIQNLAGFTNAEVKLVLGTSNNIADNNLGVVFFADRTDTDAIGSTDLQIQTSNGTSTSTKVIVKHNGNVGIGDNTPSYKLDIAGDMQVQGSSTTCVLGNGSGATNCSSDERLKTNIVEIDSALDKIDQLRGVTFNWKDTSKDQTTKIGVIAQDVEKVFPEVVGELKDGTKTVDYAALVAPLIEATKELKAENEILREDIKALKNHTNFQSSEGNMGIGFLLGILSMGGIAGLLVFFRRKQA